MNPTSIPPPHHLLAVYGTLAPGRVNYPRVQGFGGKWFKAWVRGTVRQDHGFPVFTYDIQAPEIEVDVLESTAIDWDTLDEFEGRNYRRVLVPVRHGEKIFTANIYAWAKTCFRPEKFFAK